MDAETEMSSVRISWWNAGGYDQVRAEWGGSAVPYELVHHVLGWIRPFAGITGGRVDGVIPISLDCRITFGSAEEDDLPF